MSTELVAQLRAELAPLNGPVRLPGLCRLGQALASEYTATGPGLPAAKPYLDEAITVLEEALEYVEDDDPVRGRLALPLGSLLNARYSAHGGVDQDRDRGIEMLEAVVASVSLPPVELSTGRLFLGQLYLGRATAYLRSPGLGVVARGGGDASAQAMADLGRAEECLREVVDGEPVSDELMTFARMMVEMAGAMRSVLRAVSGDLIDFDMSRLAGVMATVQQFQERVKRGGGLGYRLPQTGFFTMPARELAAADPADRPVAVVQRAEPATEPAPVTERPVLAASPPPTDAEALRSSLYALLPARDGSAEAVWQAAADLLLPGTPTPDAATVDEMVALASMLAELPGPDPTQAAVDAYLLAVTLLLRDRLDGGSTGADRRAGARALLTAAQRVPLSHPAGLVILRSLGAFLSETHPLDGVASAIADGYADRIDTAIAAGVADPQELATLCALRSICRAAAALAQLRGAVGAVPPEYPWSAPIKAAGQLASSVSG